MTTIPPPPEDLERLIPLLPHLAELIHADQEIGAAEIAVLCMGVGIDEPELQWATRELQRWIAVLTTAHRARSPQGRDLAVRALTLRGVPEASARLAVGTLGTDNTGHNASVQVDPHTIFLGELPSGTTGSAELRVSGGPGTASPGSDAVSVEPSTFGPGETVLHISVIPPAEPGILWDTVALDTTTDRVVIDINWQSPQPQTPILSIPDSAIALPLPRLSTAPSTPPQVPPTPPTPPQVPTGLAGPMIAGGVAIVLIAALICWLIRRDDGPHEVPSATGSGSTAFRQISAVNTVLNSGRTRSGLVAALDRVRSCEHPTTGINTIRKVTQARRIRLGQVRHLKVDAIANGTAIKNHLTAAMSASLKADEHFLAWARRHAANDCPKGWATDPDYKRALAFSRKATAAKRDFVGLWNPLARENGLPERSEDDI